MARGVKFRILEVEGLYYPCSENKGADYREADLRLFVAYAKVRFSHDAAHLAMIIDRPDITSAATIIQSIVLYYIFTMLA